MNRHKRINKLLASFVLGELPQQQVSEVKIHLAGCHPCSSELKRLEGLLDFAGRMGRLYADKQTCESAKIAILETVEGKQRPLPRPSIDLKHIWRRIMKARIAKLATAAAIIIAVFVGIYYLGGLIDPANVAWAKVTNHVAQVDYVHVYYLKSRDDVLRRHFEAWYAKGKMIMRGNKGDTTYDDGQTQQTFDEQGRRVAKEASYFAEGRTFLELFSGGLLSDRNEQFLPQIPTNVGDDFLIYTFNPPQENSDWLESISVTVGKNSLLPIQMKVYHKDADYDLVMFDYGAPERQPEFFEPPTVASANCGGEVMLDGDEVIFNIEGAPGLRQAQVRLHDKYDGPSEQFPLDYIHSNRLSPEFCRAVSEKLRKTYERKGGPIFRLEVSFVTDEGYQSGTNDLIALWLNEAQQCGTGSENGGLDNWPDGKYRNIRFSPLLKPTEKEDTYIAEISCWLKTKND